MWSLKNRVILLFLCSASVVTLARILSAAELDYDLTIQIQAAQNLLDGKGLSIYSLMGEDDLAKPNQLVTLTYFPCGYSLWAAALMGMGFSLGAVVKAYGAVATILGWWGWAKLAYAFLREGLERGGASRLAGAIIVISSPLLFTPPWHGTDIFLWAAIPWVLDWLVIASDKNKLWGLWLDVLAGVVCGFCVLIRYASTFLAIYAGFLIFWQSKTSLRVLARRWAVFAAGLVPFLAFQFYLNQFVSTAEARPGGLTFGRGVWAAVEQLWKAFRWLTAANFTVVWWMPKRVIMFLTQPSDQAPWSLGATAAVFALPLLLAINLGCRSVASASRDIRIAAVGLFIAFPVLLWGCAVFGVFYVGVLRYYSPLMPLALFAAYIFACGGLKQENKIQGVLRMASAGYLSGYICMAVYGIALLVLPGERGSGRRVNFVGTRELHQWPSMKVTYEFSPAREYVLALLKEQPDTVLVTNRENWFYADPGVDRSRLHRFLRLRASYVSGPAHILIVATDPRGDVPEEALYFFLEDGKPRRLDYFDGRLDLHMLKRFPAESVKILETWIPEGTTITLNKPAK